MLANVAELCNAAGLSLVSPFRERGQRVSLQTTNRTFDDLARGLASGDMSRRRAIGLMGAALVEGALASLGIGEAAADQCKRNGKACKKDKQCCSGNCEGGTCAPACVPTDSQGCTADGECCSGSALCIDGPCLEPKTACTCTCLDGAITGCCGAGCPNVCGDFCADHGGLISAACTATFIC
jgi:hypothetical protein